MFGNITATLFLLLGNNLSDPLVHDISCQANALSQELQFTMAKTTYLL